MMSRRATRRLFLSGLVSTAAAVALAACATPAPTATPAPAAAPAAPAPAAPAAAATAVPAAKPAASAEKIELAWWTHGAEEVNKKTMLNLLVKNYEEKNPNTKV